MSDIFDKIANTIEESTDGKQQYHPFYLYEPWDVEKRPQWMIDKAIEDGVDLGEGKVLKAFGTDPHPFQTGYMMSTKPIRVKLGGSQIGKSYDPQVEAQVMMTGEIPFSLRYEKGYETGIKRLVTPENVIRFGRHDIRTRSLIDHNPHVPVDEKEWDCGTVKGAGVYPQEKIAPPGSQIWIGTYQRALSVYWWPRFGDGVKNLVPREFIDMKRGNNGLNKQENTVHFLRDCKLLIITYESGYQRAEAEMAWAYIADEEPLDKKIFNAAQQHCRYMSIVMTPYNGITWTSDIIFPKRKNPNVAIFHATQYDSPYQKNEDVDDRKETMEPWVIGARVYGVPMEQTGNPYFDRAKINLWINRYTPCFEYKTFEPAAPFNGMVSNYGISKLPGLIDVKVKETTVDEDNQQTTWRIYEDPEPLVPYVCAVDPAEGAATPEDAGDTCAAGIMRPPKEGEDRPVIVATIRSTLETIAFARTVAYAMRHYNNALLAAETKRHAVNAAFAGEVRDWPFWYYFTSVQDSTGKARQQAGWDTSAGTRDSIFELIKEWLDSYSELEYPKIPDEPLLRELAGAVVAKTKGGKFRCDHTREGTLDSAIWFGILLYVLKHSMDQVRCNLKPPKRKAVDRHQVKKNSSIPCNLSGMGYRRPHATN